MPRLTLNILQKYILFLMFVSVIPLFITGLVSFQISHQVLQNETNRYANQLVNSQKLNLQLETEQIKTLMANVLSVEAITNTFEASLEETGNPIDELVTQAQIGYILNGFSNLRGLVSIDLFTNSGKHYRVGDTLNTHDIRQDVLERVTRRLQEPGSETVWIGVEDNVNVNSAYPIVLTAAKLVTRSSAQDLEQHTTGLILVNYNLNTLYDQFYRRETDSQAYQMIFDAEQRIIFHPNKALIGKYVSKDMAAQFTNPNGSLQLKIDGQPMYITYTHLGAEGWVILHLIPQSEIDKKTILIGMVTVICLVVCLALITLYAIVYSRQVVMPVRAMIHQFQMFQSGVVNWNRTLPVPAKDEIGELVRWFNTFSDSIKARQIAEDQLRHDAFYDLLTELPNRALFMDRLEQAILRSQRRPDEYFAVLFMDIDSFKLINDSLGHSVGDDLLKTVAERLQKCVRTTDTVARLGGDEFVMLLNNIHHLEDATQVADRILKAISSPVELGGHQVVISTSIGILFSDMSYDSPMAYLRDADIAMYCAKSSGKARYEIFNASMRDSVVYRMGLETDLRQAIDAGEIKIFYQPIIALETGHVVSFEALLRWTHPQLGPVSPAHFIEVAEETGLIHPLGHMVLREACLQTAAWQQELAPAEPLMVNVNISRRQFIQKDLVQRIEAILQDSGLDASCLNLEITESVIMQDMRATASMLEQLRELRVRIEMDDFGTGYSSLNHLTRFKFDVIKIDRSFVNEILSDQRQAGLVQSIISMAHSLGMLVVAEGIENEQQLEWLKTAGCEYGQGYLFSPALSSADAARFIQEQLAGEATEG